jgi:hypothetical protein
MEGIGRYVEAMINNYIQDIAKTDMQMVIGNSPSYHTVDTVKRGNDGDEMHLPFTSIITPYAGDGFGMLCAPRTGQNVVILPVKGKDSAPAVIGRIFAEGENIPLYKIGDFLIHHETGSRLNFGFTQPIYNSNNVLVGHLLKLDENKDDIKADSRIFTVTMDDNAAASPLREGDEVSIIMFDVPENNTEPVTRSNDGAVDPRLSWKTKVYRKDGSQELLVKITDLQLVNGIAIPDYSNPELKQFMGFRILPPKGILELKHYTSSGLFIEEYPDYALIDISPDGKVNPKLVRYNVNATQGDIVRIKEANGEETQISKHRPKGQLRLLNYNDTGLIIKEKQIQYRGTGTEILLQLRKEPPLSDVNGELRHFHIPSLQFIMEDITQDERDHATRATLRQISSGSVGKYTTFSDRQEEISYQEACGLFGADWANTDSVPLSGSGFVIEDFLKQYNEENKGWAFVPLKAAEEQYKEFDEKFYKSAVDPATLKRDKDKGEYDIDPKKRIIPASARRDVLKKVEGESQKIPLLSSQLEPLTEENRLLVGQKGYLYTTDDELDNREDGYLCNPKGKVSFLHYTHSGIDVRELDPDADFHAIQASFTLYNWDLGQYERTHKFSKNRDSGDMLFGPYPIPVARIVMESAKYELRSQEPDEPNIKGDAVIPTLPTAHTAHPKAALSEKDHSGRTTLATYGETATWVGIEQYSSHIQSVFNNELSATEEKQGLDDKRFGSRLLFKDYVIHAKPSDNKTPLIAAAKWQNERGKQHKLLAPKGSVELQHYTGSGLALFDKKQHYLKEDGGGHAMALKLSMRSFDFLAMKDGEPVVPYDHDDGYFFCEMLSNETVDHEAYKFELEEAFFKEDDSQRGKGAKEAHGKRAAKTGFAHGTARSKNSAFDARMFVEDYVIPKSKQAEQTDMSSGAMSVSGLPYSAPAINLPATGVTSLSTAEDDLYEQAVNDFLGTNAEAASTQEKRIASKKIRVEVAYKRGGLLSSILGSPEQYVYEDITPSKGIEFYIVAEELQQYDLCEITELTVMCAEYNAISTGTSGKVYVELGYELTLGTVVPGTPVPIPTLGNTAKKYAARWREELGSFTFETGKSVANTYFQPYNSNTASNVTSLITGQIADIGDAVSLTPTPTGRFIVEFDSICDKEFELFDNPNYKPFKPSIKMEFGDTLKKMLAEPRVTMSMTPFVSNSAMLARNTAAEADEESEEPPDYIPSHIYKPKEENKPRELLMPKGECGIEFWNFSCFKFGDWEMQNEEDVDPDDLERGKKQKPFALTLLNAWNNQKITNPDECPARPYSDASAAFHMFCNANTANFKGKDAVMAMLHTFSNKVEDEDYGSVLLIEDFIKPDEDGGEEAYDTCHHYKMGETSGDGGTITDFDVAGGTDVVIPDKIDGVDVKAIGDEALMGKGLTSLALPGGLESIGKMAAAFNDLTQLATEAVKKIGEAAFQGNKIAEALLGEGLETIGANAFAGNLLQNLSLPSSLSSLGSGAFTGNKLQSVSLPETLASVAGGLGDGVFQNNELTNVSLPSNLTKLTKSMFADNKLANIALPGGLTDIADGALKNNMLSSLSLPSALEKIGSNAFRNNLLSSLNLPDGLKSIGNMAFANNPLSNVSIPDSVTSIGKGAFAGLAESDIALGGGYDSFISAIQGQVLGHIGKAPSSLTIPSQVNAESVTKIITGAFKDNLLEQVNLPEGITEIGEAAFQGNLLEAINLPPTVKKIAADALQGNSIKDVVIGAGVDIANSGSLGEFGDLFKQLYDSTGKLAGTYAFDAGVGDWMKMV